MSGVTKEKPARIDLASADIVFERMKALKAIFPEVFTEGRVDIEKLRTTLGDAIEGSKERYYFSWAGKQQSIQILQTPSLATLKPDINESICFEKTRNLFIEGDNLEVLKLLYKPYFNRVNVIFIDPPYNTGNDFIYPDNYTDPLDTYLSLTGQKDSNGNLLSSNLETSGRYHSAWLSMMYPRLFLARQLLSENGVIFITIDDHESYNLRIIMNEIFGEENFIANIVWQKKQSPQNDATYLSDMHDHILVYTKLSKNSKSDPNGWQRQLLARGQEQEERYSNPDNDPRGDWGSVDYTCNKTADERPNLYYPIINPNTGKEVWPSRQHVWRYEKDTHERNVKEKRIWWGSSGDNFPRYKKFRSELADGIVPSTWWDRASSGDNQEARRELRSMFNDLEDAFNTPKPVRLIKRILKIASGNKDAIVLDFFAGSCTTAQAVLELNHEDGGKRQFIMVQLPEPIKNAVFKTIADIGKERIRRAINNISSSDDGQVTLAQIDCTTDLGFKVFKLAPSNFKQWKHQPSNTDAATYTKQMELFNDPLINGSPSNDVIYEVAIKEGLSLTSHIENVSAVNEAIVWKVIDDVKGQQFYISLDDSLSIDNFKPLCLSKEDLLICRNVAMNDTTAANLALQCRLKLI